jgi:hypothetical protein
MVWTAVLTTDCVNEQVLFAEVQWIGDKEANPSEAPLEMPKDLQTPIMRSPATGACRGEHQTVSAFTLYNPSC